MLPAKRLFHHRVHREHRGEKWWIIFSPIKLPCSIRPILEVYFLCALGALCGESLERSL
jgi:hypothetical protein